MPLSPLTVLRLPAAACLAAAGLTAATPAAGATPVAAATAPATLAISGHGFGHGRGMGQYGAYGYARQQGWSWQQIVGHFYGGTGLAQVATGQPVAVHLVELDGAGTAASGSGVTATWAGGSVAGPVAIARSGGTLVVGGQAVPGDVTVSGSGPVTLALPGGGTRSYLGTITVQAATGRTLDTLGLDQYVAGVVPAESPASWGTDGEAALEAQAVAARSYALAWLAANGSASAICDTPSCQVYDGDQDVAGDPANSAYTGYSDAAVSATAGQVLTLGGAVALAEFSSSTGGYTAGGTYPAVPDDGDVVSPYHDWSTTVPVSSVQAAWPQIGAFVGAAVTARNGLGDLGGRATQVTIEGTAGTVVVSGDAFAAALGLLSDWFAISGSGLASGGLDGYWILSGDAQVHAFGGAGGFGSPASLHLNAPAIAMAPTHDGAGYWVVAADGGIFSYGDAAFHGSTGGMRLNAPVIGMAPTPDGGGYWLVAADGGVFSFGDARFYGSTGGMRLNRPVVGMAATADGGGYWLFAADGGMFAFGDAAFHGSAANLALAAPIVGVVPTSDGGGYTLVGRDGGIFAYGDARYLGSLPGEHVAASVSSVATTADGGGYLVLTGAGAVYPFGDAPDMGDLTTQQGWSGGAIDLFGHRG